MREKPTMIRDLSPITGWELHQLPEWRALLDRLGIPADLRTMRIVIDSGGPDDLVRVAHHTCVPAVSDEDRESIETTNVHNVRWSTHRPPSLQTEADVPKCREGPR